METEEKVAVIAIILKDRDLQQALSPNRPGIAHEVLQAADAASALHQKQLMEEQEANAQVAENAHQVEQEALAPKGELEAAVVERELKKAVVALDGVGALVMDANVLSEFRVDFEGTRTEYRALHQSLSGLEFVIKKNANTSLVFSCVDLFGYVFCNEINWFRNISKTHNALVA